MSSGYRPVYKAPPVEQAAREDGLDEYRCQNPRCRKLLFKARLKGGLLSIRCKKCGHWNEFYIDNYKI